MRKTVDVILEKVTLKALGILQNYSSTSISVKIHKYGRLQVA